jgi:small GTP-binding protein
MLASADRPSLLTRYDNLRRRQREQITHMVDTLGRVDGLPPEQLEQARDALFHADHPYLIALVGAFNAGKSSLINALLGEPVLSVGATPTTSKIAIVRHGPQPQTLSGGESDTIFHPAPLLERVSLVDTPGLESVFKEHEATTRRFLHRADLVFLVMLATQAMSASSVQNIQALRAYGKRLIVVVNQIDLLEPDERETVRNFVTEQGKLMLGFAPEVWLVSAKWGLEAAQSIPRDPDLWAQSGFEQIEKYLTNALSDTERVRQKLETPLQIMRNVLNAAEARVRAQQDALAEYRRSSQNVRGQIESAIKEQEATVTELLAEIDKRFAEATERGKAAIIDVFAWGKGFRLAFSGVAEAFGILRIFRRFGAGTPAKAAFEAHKVAEPLDEIMPLADRLGPRLEGRDVKDVDDLILYAKREIERLPGALQAKIIGKLEAPTTYDRAIMKEARAALSATLDRARVTEFKRIDEAVRNTIVLLGVYVLVVILIAALLLLAAVSGAGDGGTWLLMVVLPVVLVIGGVTLMPLRGVIMQRAYANTLKAVQKAFDERIKKAAADQIGFGKQMRQDAIAPFLRMVEAQLSEADAVKTALNGHAQALTGLESELGTLKG